MRLKKAVSLIVICLLIVQTMIPMTAQAKENKHKVVRVGWYDSTYNTVDESGHRTGYAYEYQLKLSAYNGWKYEYVSGSWPDLLQMLEEGEIDLMSGCFVH